MSPGTYPDVTALVTGGVSGIGAAAAARLRAAGVRVVTVDLSPDGDETLDVTDRKAKPGTGERDRRRGRRVMLRRGRADGPRRVTRWVARVRRRPR